jgi:hypothetical protein
MERGKGIRHGPTDVTEEMYELRRRCLALVAIEIGHESQCRGGERPERCEEVGEAMANALISIVQLGHAIIEKAIAESN